jgi:hypothetical protein
MSIATDETTLLGKLRNWLSGPHAEAEVKAEPVEEVPEGTLGELCAKFSELTERERRNKDEAAEIKTEKDFLAPRILDLMGQDGVTSVKVGGRTVHMRRTIWPKIETDRDDVMRALEMAGWGDIVKPNYNANTLAAMIRELDRDDEDMPIMPPEFNGVLSVAEKFEVRAVK